MMRAAVVGIGGMGKQHARLYNDLEGVALVAVADTDAARGAAVADRLKVPLYPDAGALFERERPDVISVAVPTESHHAVAAAAIDRGIHVLVEKPLAASEAQAQDLIERAERAGVVLTVGHVERFNPAIVELKRRLQLGELGPLFQIECRRLSPFPSYIHDVGVGLDLATHELDVLRYLLEREPETVFARTMRNLHPTHEDGILAILGFRDKLAALIEVNWLTPIKQRELRVTGARGLFIVDYVRQDLFLYENGVYPSGWETLALFRGVAEGNVVKLHVAKQEPLRRELQAFTSAVRARRAPEVTGHDGLRALALANLLIRSSEEGRVLNVSAGS